MNIPKNNWVLDADDELDTLVNAAGRFKIVGLVNVGKEFLKTYVEMVKEGTNDLVDNGNLVEVHSEMD